MTGVQKPAMALDDIDRLKDQGRRAVEAAAFAAYAEDRAKRSRDIRDDACRKLKASGKTISEIAAITGMSVGMVRVVTR